MDFYDSAAEGSQYEAHGYPEKHVQWAPKDVDIDQCVLRRHCFVFEWYGKQRWASS